VIKTGKDGNDKMAAMAIKDSDKGKNTEVKTAMANLMTRLAKLLNVVGSKINTATDKTTARRHNKEQRD
jgi:hypothetical protein